jgi:hypothetical protein
MNVGEPLKTPSYPRASSWSWAAYDRPTQFPLPRQTLWYTTNCRLKRIVGCSSGWMNGPGTVLVSGELFISLYREELSPINSTAWENEDTLGQDTALRLYNVYNARKLLWAKGPRSAQSSCSWLVFDRDTLRTQQDYQMPLTFASLATFFVPGGRNHSKRIHMGLFLEPAGSGNTYRRVGAGVVRETPLLSLMHLNKPGQAWSFQKRDISLL